MTMGIKVAGVNCFLDYVIPNLQGQYGLIWKIDIAKKPNNLDKDLFTISAALVLGTSFPD